MKKYLLYTILSLFLCVGQVQAQQYGGNQHYKMDYHLINPGATGMAGQVIILNYVSRWDAFAGNPKKFTGAYNGLVSFNIGLGSLVDSDYFGSLNQTYCQL